MSDKIKQTNAGGMGMIKLPRTIKKPNFNKPKKDRDDD